MQHARRFQGGGLFQGTIGADMHVRGRETLCWRRACPHFGICKQGLCNISCVMEPTASPTQPYTAAGRANSIIIALIASLLPSVQPPLRPPRGCTIHVALGARHDPGRGDSGAACRRQRHHLTLGQLSYSLQSIPRSRRLPAGESVRFRNGAC
jgi:hypothetical protein